MHELTNWLSEHSLLVSAVAGASLALLAMTVLATPWAVSKLPSDYLLKRLDTPSPHGLGRWLVMLVRCVAGLIFVLLGLLMMITPGPGLVMLLLGISIAEFPGKGRLLTWVATRPNVMSSLNWMRRRYGKPPFIAPDAEY